MAEQLSGIMSQTSGARPIRSQVLQDIRNALLGNIAQPDLSAQLEALSDGQRQHVLQMAKLIRSGGNGNKSWRDAIRSMYPRMDLSRFSAAPRARLSHLSFESDRAFPAQC